LLVSNLNVAPDKEVEELAVGPNFVESKFEKTTGRLDAKSDGGTGVERKSSGFWQCGTRSHAQKNNREENDRIRVAKGRIREGRVLFELLDVALFDLLNERLTLRKVVVSVGGEFPRDDKKLIVRDF